MHAGKGPRSRRERREKREERREKPPTSEPSLGQHQSTFNGAKKIHLISEKLILAVAKERFERTIAAAVAELAMAG